MSLTPRGMSIQEAYRIYSDGGFFVNRKYQRKLVWTVEEKEHLIDSILSELPIPLILLASVDTDQYEIIDGLQRLNAIFSFIENNFSYDSSYFDIEQFARAKQVSEGGTFTPNTDNLLEAGKCADFLDYQLAVTIHPSSDEEIITDIFGRINSGGKQLSNQDKRQAGMLDNLSGVIRVVSSEIRGDSSRDLLSLREMPEISIDSSREKLGYGVKAEEVFWVKHGVLNKKLLRESEDEEMVADVVATILLNSPIGRSKDLFDDLYDSGSELHQDLNKKLLTYGADRITNEIKVTLSIFKEILEKAGDGQIFKQLVNPGSPNPVKNSFYSVFMALFDLVVNQELSPENYDAICAAITGLQAKLTSSAHYAKIEDRVLNINSTKGLIQPYFVKKDPPVLTHGPGLKIDLENSIRRSKIESNRYECKQGFYDLSDNRNYDTALEAKLINTACAIANVGPEADGFIFIGVADKKSDAERVLDLDGVALQKLTNDRYVVGIDRELAIEGKDMDAYVNKVLSFFRDSDLSEPLKSQILSQLDVAELNDLTIMRLRIPKQKELSYVGEQCFVREGSNTLEITGKKLIAANKMFE